MNPGRPDAPKAAPKADRQDNAEEDPTHALDDFVRRMRQADPATTLAHELSDLSDLGDLAGLADRIHPERAAPPPRATGGVLRSGQRWAADQVQDVPVIELPTAANAAGTDAVTDTVTEANAADQATRQASQMAAAAYSAEARKASTPVWQPDATALQLRRAAHPRVLAQWQPEAWVGAMRQVSDSATELVNTPTGPVVDTHAPNQLLLLWPPQRGGPPTTGRWPARVLLMAVVPGPAAAEAALAVLPADALLWLATGDAAVAPPDSLADWALAAEIALHHQPGLQPLQIDGLRAFISTERETSFARLNADYQLPAAGGAVVRR